MVDGLKHDHDHVQGMFKTKQNCVQYIFMDYGLYTEQHGHNLSIKKI